MKKRIVTLVAVPLMLVFSSPLFAESGKSLYSPKEMHKAASGMKTTVYKQESASESAKRLIGMTLVNDQGEKIGEITDMKMDPELGRVDYFIVRLPEEGGKEVAVPLQACSIKIDEGHVTLTAKEKMLETAPTQLPGVGDEEFFYMLQGHYGVNPAWQIVPRR